MESRSLRTSLLRLTVLIPLTSMVLPPAVYGTSDQHHGPVSTNFSTAVKTAINFTCKHPQPRAHRLEDVIKHDQNSWIRASQPTHIILKRCDGHTGCCSNPGKACLPVSTYEESIEIEVRNMKNNRTMKQWKNVVQHKKCSCIMPNGE